MLGLGKKTCAGSGRKMDKGWIGKGRCPVCHKRGVGNDAGYAKPHKRQSGGGGCG